MYNNVNGILKIRCRHGCYKIGQAKICYISWRNLQLVE